MTKRGNGEGSIAKHATRDLWMARWTEEVQGRTVRRTVYAKTKEEAVAKLRAATIRVEAGQPGIDSATPFKTVAEQWRRTAQISQGISSRSMQTYSGVLRLHVYPVIGHVPLKAVKPSHVALVLASMSEKACRGPTSTKPTRPSAASSRWPLTTNSSCATRRCR